MTNGRRSPFKVPLDRLTKAGVLARIDRSIERRETVLHASLNAAKVVEAEGDARVQHALRRFDLVTADGQSVVWAARLLGYPVPERVPGIDLMEAVVRRAADAGWRVYLLGARPEIVERTAAILQQRHRRLSLAGFRDGYFAADEEEEVVREIRDSRPDVLFVALESPKKELFLDRHRQELGVGFAMGVGGAFDVIAGARGRAPRWLQRAGLEWAYRMVQEPRRLGPRYLRTNGRFVVFVGREAIGACTSRWRRTRFSNRRDT